MHIYQDIELILAQLSAPLLSAAGEAGDPLPWGDPISLTLFEEWDLT